MTEYQTIFNAFLAKITADDWAQDMDVNAIFSDWVSIMESALPLFKFPRCSLKRTYDEDFADGYFFDELGDQEIQIIATLMKQQWLERTIHNWENVKVMYDAIDFSQGNLLNNFIKLLEHTKNESIKLQKTYSRSIEDKDGNRRPYPFSKLAGGNNG